MTKPQTSNGAIPLCVDLDGTLARTDTLHEALLLLLKQRPWLIIFMPFWLFKGKAAFKHWLNQNVTLLAASLPYRQEVIELIANAHLDHRPIILATGASSYVAKAVALHLGLFDEILSSDETRNLTGKHKAQLLAERFGEGGFDYIGNDHADLESFSLSRRAYLISSHRGLRRLATGQNEKVELWDDESSSLKAWIKAIRVHQWLKNALIFVPLAAAHKLGDLALTSDAIIAFISFSLFASSVYILNDLFDLASDRRHPRKRHRPFAAGTLPVVAGLPAIAILITASAGLATLLPLRFAVILLLYAFLTLSYSFRLKQQVIVDVILLAGLYTIRVLAGAAATGIALSFWLLAFSMFVFLCLALVKRYSELQATVARGDALAGRGYLAGDLPVILSLGSASGMISVLVLALYTQSDIVVHTYPSAQWLWLAPPLMLYWIARIWMKVQRGEVHDDPVVFAARDWQSIVILVILLAIFQLANSSWMPL